MSNGACLVRAQFYSLSELSTAWHPSSGESYSAFPPAHPGPPVPLKLLHAAHAAQAATCRCITLLRLPLFACGAWPHSSLLLPSPYFPCQAGIAQKTKVLHTQSWRCSHIVCHSHTAAPWQTNCYPTPRWCPNRNALRMLSQQQYP